jgi:ABC-type polysaccharide/polyol phosphate export permease
MKSPAEIMDPHPETLPDGKASATGELQHRVSAKTSHVLADLLFVLTLRDIKIKYKQSVMGLLWAVLMPMIIVGAGMLIRVAMARMSNTPLVPGHLASLCVKAVPWAFFVSAVRFATSSLTTNINLVTKINCPRIAFPVSSVLSSLFDMVVAMVPLIVVLVLLGITPSLMLLWVPILVGLLVLLVMGLGVALSAGNLFFRDVKYIVEVLLTFAIFFTPVLYDVDMFGDWSFWLLLNPISPILEGLRSVVVLKTAPDPRWLSYAALVSVAVFALGWRLFRRLEPVFADRI